MVAGTRGRIAEDDESKRARGNPGHRKLAPVAQLPLVEESVEVPAPYRSILKNKPALEYWAEDAPICAAMGSLSKPDCYLFAELCSAKAEYQRLEKESKGKPTFVKTKDGKGKYHVKAESTVKLEKLFKKILELSEKFGLTAGSRKRNGWKLPAAKVNSAKQQELSALLNGHRNR